MSAAAGSAALGPGEPYEFSDTLGRQLCLHWNFKLARKPVARTLNSIPLSIDPIKLNIVRV